MANGPGVSMRALPDGRWRVRWRETVTTEGAERRLQRERVVRDEATALRLRATILRAVEEGQVWEPALREVRAVATFDDIATGWLRAQVARGLAPSTLRAYKTRLALALRVWRSKKRIRDDVPVPGSVLTRTGVVELAVAMREEVHSATLYNTLSVVMLAWGWASHDPEAFPGIAPALRDPSAVIPRAPIYAAAPAPTMAECDAVIRELAKPRTGGTHLALPVAVIGRCTGLRVSQILGLTVADLNPAARTLLVRVGKGRREASEQRTIPVPGDLVAFLLPLVERARAHGGEAASIVQRRSNAKSNRGSERTLRDAWEAATQAGLVRREVWAPSTRANARPEHAFRAAYQGAMVAAGVRDEVIDALVGHAGGLRARHYVDAAARMEGMRAAVDGLPAIDWRGPTEQDDNLVAFRR